MRVKPRKNRIRPDQYGFFRRRKKRRTSLTVPYGRPSLAVGVRRTSRRADGERESRNRRGPERTDPDVSVDVELERIRKWVSGTAGMDRRKSGLLGVYCPAGCIYWSSARPAARLLSPLEAGPPRARPHPPLGARLRRPMCRGPLFLVETIELHRGKSIKM